MDYIASFNDYMDQHFEFTGQWDVPSKCGLRIIRRQDGKVLAIATEIYRENPGTPVTEWCAPLATQILRSEQCSPENFIFIEHTPDLKSKLSFYEETFDLVNFEWSEDQFTQPRWTRLSKDEIDAMMRA